MIKKSLEDSWMNAATKLGLGPYNRRKIGIEEPSLEMQTRDDPMGLC